MKLLFSSASSACWKLNDERVFRPIMTKDGDPSVGEAHSKTKLILRSKAGNLNEVTVRVFVLQVVVRLYLIW